MEVVSVEALLVLVLLGLLVLVLVAVQVLRMWVDCGGERCSWVLAARS